MQYVQWVCRCGRENSELFEECARCGAHKRESVDSDGMIRVNLYVREPRRRGGVKVETTA